MQSSGALPVRLRLRGTAPGLAVGQPVTAWLEQTVTAQGIVLPAAAVVRLGNGETGGNLVCLTQQGGFPGTPLGLERIGLARGTLRRCPCRLHLRSGSFEIGAAIFAGAAGRLVDRP